MAMEMHTSETSRFTDLLDEPVDYRSHPTKGYQDSPLVSLIEAIKPVSHLFDGIDDYVYTALRICRKPADNLTPDESAAIHLYTIQFPDQSSLHLILNRSLRSENDEQLRPWFLYLKLFLTALEKLPSKKGTVWRGIRDVDLSSKYKTGTRFTWWGVNSCTTDIEVLVSDQFFGTEGQRTLFSIECIHGKSIDNHSCFKNREQEIILAPGTCFEVIGQLYTAPGPHIIQIKEIPPATSGRKPPTSSPITHAKSPAPERKHRIFAQIITKFKTKNLAVEHSFDNVSVRAVLGKKSNQIGVTIAGDNGEGNQLNQLHHPRGICIDDDETVYIADFGNHRIIEWKSNARQGRIVAGGNGRGDKLNQLSAPTDVVLDRGTDCLIISDQDNRRIMRWSRQNNTIGGQIITSDIDCFGLAIDKSGCLYISDYKKNEVRRWKRGDKDGTLVAGGNGQGYKLNQFNCPAFIFVDEDYSLYVSDRINHRVMKWIKDAKQGIIVAGGHGAGDNLTHLSLPHGVTVDQYGQIYVAEWGNHRVMRWSERTREGTIVAGGNGEGQRFHQLNYPAGSVLDKQGNLYVVDCWNNRVQKFQVNF